MTRWVWTVRVGDDYRDESLPFLQRRDALVRDLKASRWYRVGHEEYDDLWDLVDELSDVESVETFDYILCQIYDIADDERAWLDLIGIKSSR